MKSDRKGIAPCMSDSVIAYCSCSPHSYIFIYINVLFTGSVCVCVCVCVESDGFWLFWLDKVMRSFNSHSTVAHSPTHHTMTDRFPFSIYRLAARFLCIHAHKHTHLDGYRSGQSRIRNEWKCITYTAPTSVVYQLASSRRR